MRKIVQSNKFKKDLKKVSQSGKHNIADLKMVINFLIQDELLPKKHQDHALTGEWHDFRECHIRPDWLLIYEKQDALLVLARTGSHSELFAQIFRAFNLSSL